VDANWLNSNAIVIKSTTQHGKPCQIVDNTASVEHKELESILQSLIENDEFGMKMLSDSNGRMDLNKPRLAHIQIGDQLYRLVLYPYEAIIDHY